MIDSDISFSELAKEDINKKDLSDILLKISGDKQLVSDLHAYVKESLEYGLDEIAFVDEIMNPNKYSLQFRSTSKLSSQFKNLVHSSEKNSLRSANEEIFSVDGLEIYWPYSEDWDGESSPVITFRPSDDEDTDNEEENIDDYTLMAYKLVPLNDVDFRIDSLLVNEAYAMNNPD